MDAQEIVAGLGGADNIIEIEPCTTRLRAEVRDASLVDEAALKRAGAEWIVGLSAVAPTIVSTLAERAVRA